MAHFLAEHRRLGDIHLHVVNISAHGFMTASDTGLTRGERVVIRLPHIGRIEAHLIWSQEHRAGFQFERIIRNDDFAAPDRSAPAESTPAPGTLNARP